MIRIAAIRFEPGTLLPDAVPSKAEAVSSSTAMHADALGVWIGDDCVPWHRVHSWRRVAEQAKGKKT